MINVPLLEATMQAIKDHPELHDQSNWFTQTDCGTAMCFAGWACHLSGMHQVLLGTTSGAVSTPSGVTTAREAATEVLGLTFEQAGIMFAGGNTASMLELMVKDLANTGELAGNNLDYYFAS